MTTQEATIEKVVEEAEEIDVCDGCGMGVGENHYTFELDRVGQEDWASEPIHFCSENCLKSFRATEVYDPSNDESSQKSALSRCIEWLWSPYDEAAQDDVLSVSTCMMGAIPWAGAAWAFYSYLEGVNHRDNAQIRSGHIAAALNVCWFILLVVA